MITSSLNLISFGCVKMYPIMLESLDLHGCLATYGIGCIVGFIFVLFVLNETKGKSLDDVGVVEKLDVKLEKEISSSRL